MNLANAHLNENENLLEFSGEKYGKRAHQLLLKTIPESEIQSFGSSLLPVNCVQFVPHLIAQQCKLPKCENHTSNARISPRPWS